MNESSQFPNNRAAVTSLTFALLTALFACAGLSPIPFTGFVCLPSGFFTALFALIFGAIALAQIRKRGERGSPLAWTGIIIGGLVFLCGLCVLLLFASLFIFAPDYLPNLPPSWEGYPL